MAPLSLESELVNLMHTGEYANVVPEEHVLAYCYVTAAGIENRIIDNGCGVDLQPSGVAVHPVAIQGVKSLLFDALGDQPSHRWLEKSVSIRIAAHSSLVLS
jgi:hypothetical protein